MMARPVFEICTTAQQHADDLFKIEELVGYMAAHQQEYSAVDLHLAAECMEALLRKINKRDVRTFNLAMRLVDIRFKQASVS